MFHVIKKERQKSNIKYSNSKHSKTVEIAGESVPAVFFVAKIFFYFLFSRRSDILKMNIKNTKKKGENKDEKMLSRSKGNLCAHICRGCKFKG